MIKNSDWMDALERGNDLLQRLNGATTALSLFAENSAWVSMNHIDQKLFSAADSVLAQLTQMDDWYKPSTLGLQASTLGLLGNSLSAGYSAAVELAARPSILDGIAKMGTFASMMPAGMLSTADQLSKILKLYQTPDIVSHVDSALSQLASFDTSILEAARAFDLSGVEVSDDGVITYDGVEYGSEEISAVLDTQIEIAKKPTLREKFESLKKRLWLLLLLLNIVMFLPQVPETVEFYRNTVAQIQEIWVERSHFCFTVKECSILREDANSSSARILYLPYDTPLEILDDVPRWYQVKYSDEDGIETIGWISKISVSMEE